MSATAKSMPFMSLLNTTELAGRELCVYILWGVYNAGHQYTRNSCCWVCMYRKYTLCIHTQRYASTHSDMHPHTVCIHTRYASTHSTAQSHKTTYCASILSAHDLKRSSASMLVGAGTLSNNSWGTLTCASYSQPRSGFLHMSVMIVVVVCDVCISAIGSRRINQHRRTIVQLKVVHVVHQDVDELLSLNSTQCMPVSLLIHQCKLYPVLQGAG